MLYGTGILWGHLAAWYPSGEHHLAKQSVLGQVSPLSKKPLIAYGDPILMTSPNPSYLLKAHLQIPLSMARDWV